MSITESDPIRELVTSELNKFRAAGYVFSNGVEAMLYYPLSEQSQPLDEAQARKSIALIVSAILKTDRPQLYRLPWAGHRAQPIQAVDLIRGFWSAYCNIPPFCLPPER